MPCLKEEPFGVLHRPIHNSCLVEIHVVVKSVLVLCHFRVTVTNTDCPLGVVNILWKNKGLTKFWSISRVLQSRFLRGSERHAVSNFLQSQCGVWISVSQSKDLKKYWSRREKRWSCRLTKSHIYHTLPPSIRFFYPSLQSPVCLSIVKKVTITTNNFVDDASGLCSWRFVFRS